MFHLIQTRTEDVSPKRAREILNKFNNFDGQRPLTTAWAQYLGHQMENGHFTKANIAFAQNGSDVQYLMNGQHCCEGSALFDQTFRATIDYYKCDTKDDVWKLFGTFDVNKPRSERNIMVAARNFMPEALKSIDIAALAACGSALAWLEDRLTPKFDSKEMDKTKKPGLVKKYEKDVLFYHSCLQAAGVRRAVVPVCACIIATGRMHKEKALDFWSRVLGGFGLIRGTPEHHLHKDITAGLITKFGNFGGSRNIKMWNLCASWWNSFITKKERKAVKLESFKGIVELSKVK